MRSFRHASALLVVSFLAASNPLAAQHWPQWRGPLGSGEASATLGVSEEAALEALQALRDRGLVAMIGPPNQPLFRLERAPHLDAVLEELQGAHDQKPVEVAKLMTANAIDRARTLTARRFADAFLLRRAKKDDG